MASTTLNYWKRGSTVVQYINVFKSRKHSYFQLVVESSVSSFKIFHPEGNCWMYFVRLHDLMVILN